MRRKPEERSLEFFRRQVLVTHDEHTSARFGREHRCDNSLYLLVGGGCQVTEAGDLDSKGREGTEEKDGGSKKTKEVLYKSSEEKEQLWKGVGKKKRPGLQGQTLNEKLLRQLPQPQLLGLPKHALKRKG